MVPTWSVVTLSRDRREVTQSLRVNCRVEVSARGMEQWLCQTILDLLRHSSFHAASYSLSCPPNRTS